jgi:phage shock protein C
MGLAEDLTRLEELRSRGALSDEEFQRAKERVLGGAPAASGSPAVAAINRLRRSRDDRWLGGVCGGLAVAAGAETWIWRLIFAVLAFFGGAGLLVYVLLWIFVPEET